MRIFHEFQGIRETFRIGIGIVWVVELPRSSWKESALTRKSIFQCCEAAELFLLALASTLRIFGHLTANALLRDLNTVKILLRLHSKSLVLDPQHFFLKDISEGRPTKIPVYDFKTNARVPQQFNTIHAGEIDVVLLEGILVFYFPKASPH